MRRWKAGSVVHWPTGEPRVSHLGATGNDDRATGDALPPAKSSLTWPTPAPLECSEVAQSGEKWGQQPRPTRPTPRRGRPDRCSPASTGTRSTRRDGSPSLELSCPTRRRRLRLALDRVCLAICPQCRLGAPGEQSRRCPPSRTPGLGPSAVRLRGRRRGRDRRARVGFVLPAYLASAAGLGGEAVGRRVTRPRGDLDSRPVGRLPEGARRPAGAGAAPRRAGHLARPHALPGSARDPIVRMEERLRRAPARDGGGGP